MSIQSGLEQLNTLLPLKQRQGSLSPELKLLHQAILNTLVSEGRILTSVEQQKYLGENDLTLAIQRLGNDDLVVLDKDKRFPVGAYPVTTEITPHKLKIHEHVIYAMCALDAVSVASVFSKEVEIESQCHVTQTPLVIHMIKEKVTRVEPTSEIRVGIRWQNPTAVAAHSLCMEMVFLKDKETALTWQNGDVTNISIYSLEEAIEFGEAYFSPLLV